MASYWDPEYANSLAEFGTPRELPRCGGWLLERHIPGTDYKDAMGCYPLFACRNWSKLREDLDELADELVSVALVADPFGNFDLPLLESIFDLVKPFKEHFIADLDMPVNEYTSSHFRMRMRQIFAKVSIQKCEDPASCLDEWLGIYATLISRHGITGIRAFSRASFERMLSIPGLVMLRAVHDGVTVGSQMWFTQGDVGYSHLTACTEAGYKLNAAFALHWSAYEYFRGKLRWADIGGGAGINSANGGLTEFKRRISTGERTAYFCGRVLNQARYSRILCQKKIAGSDYFPEYRQGEFG